MVVAVGSPPNTWPTHISPFPASTSWKESAKASRTAKMRRCMRERVKAAFPSHLYGTGAGKFLMKCRVERGLRLVGALDVAR